MVAVWPITSYPWYPMLRGGWEGWWMVDGRVFSPPEKDGRHFPSKERRFFPVICFQSLVFKGEVAVVGFRECNWGESNPILVESMLLRNHYRNLTCFRKGMAQTYVKLHPPQYCMSQWEHHMPWIFGSSYQPPQSHQVTSLCHPNEIERRQHYPINLNFLRVQKVYIQPRLTKNQKHTWSSSNPWLPPHEQWKRGPWAPVLGIQGDEILPNSVVNISWNHHIQIFIKKTHQYFMESLSIGPVFFWEQNLQKTRWGSPPNKQTWQVSRYLALD